MAFRASPLGAATGSITNTDFDGEHRGIVMSAGNMSVTGGYFASGGAPADQQVVLTGGTLGITGAGEALSDRTPTRWCWPARPVRPTARTRAQR